MNLYHYRAFDKKGIMTQGTEEASSKSALREKLQQLGYSLISASPKRSKNNLSSRFFLKRINRSDLKNFFLHIEQFETAGIGLSESLEELQSIQENRLFR